MHSSYLSIMKEREKIIEKLHNQLKKISSQQVLKTNVTFGNGNDSEKATSRLQNNEALNAIQTFLGRNDDQSQPQKPETFETEKLKDAVNFQTMQRTMARSNGFSNIRVAGENEAQTALPEQVFQNFSTNQRDEWLLNSSQKSVN